MADRQLAWARLSAWGIDWLIVLGVSILFQVIGWIACTAYWLLRDGLFEGQSVGKRLMGLQVRGPAGARATWSLSATRNLLWVVPVVNLVMGVTGIYYLFTDPRGRHWGDRLANSEVVRVGAVGPQSRVP